MPYGPLYRDCLKFSLCACPAKTPLCERQIFLDKIALYRPISQELKNKLLVGAAAGEAYILRNIPLTTIRIQKLIHHISQELVA